MPFRDQTGPTSQGPMTGRRLGKCSTTENSNANFGFAGRGRGRGMKTGRGNGTRLAGRNGYASYAATIEEERDYLQERLHQINEQIQNNKE